MHRAVIVAWLVKKVKASSLIAQDISEGGTKPILNVVLGTDAISDGECTMLFDPHSVNEWFESTCPRGDSEFLRDSEARLLSKLAGRDVACAMGLLNVYLRLFLVASTKAESRHEIICSKYGERELVSSFRSLPPTMKRGSLWKLCPYIFFPIELEQSRTNLLENIENTTTTSTDVWDLVNFFLTTRSDESLKRDLIWLFAHTSMMSTGNDLDRLAICADLFNLIEPEKRFDPYLVALAITCGKDIGDICAYIETREGHEDSAGVHGWQEAVAMTTTFPQLSILAGSAHPRCISLSWPLLANVWRMYIEKKITDPSIRSSQLARSEIPDIDRICAQNKQHRWGREEELGIHLMCSDASICENLPHNHEWDVEILPDVIDVVVAHIDVCGSVAIGIMDSAWLSSYKHSEVPVESFSAVEFPNVKKFCEVDPESQYYKEDFLRLSLLCSIPVKDVCQRVISESILDQIDPRRGYRSFRTLMAIPDIVKYVADDEEGRETLIPAIINTIWDEAVYNKLKIFGDLRGLANLNLKGPPDSDGGGLCKLHSLGGGAQRANPAGEAAVLFMCRHNSVEAVCDFVRNTGSEGYRKMMADIVKNFDVKRFANDLVQSNLVSLSFPEYNPICSLDVAAYVAELTFILGGQSTTLSSYRRNIEWTGFCLTHQNLIDSTFEPIGNQMNPFCPQTEPNSASLIQNTAALVALLPSRKVASGRLDVYRKSAFSDSLPLLTSLTADLSYPTSVYFNGEEGIDAGGLRRDWFGRMAAIVSEPISDDKAGNLFKFTETSGEKLLQLNLDPDQMVLEGRGISGADGLQLTPFGRSVYYAFGRLMGIAFIQREQLGMALPSYFFAKLLNGVITLDDLSPEEEGRKKSLEKFASEFKRGGYGEAIESGDIFPDDIPNIKIDKDNIDAVVSQLADSIIPSYASVIVDQIRSGFTQTISIDQVRARFLPRHLKLFIAGESKLNVDALKTMARKLTDEVPPSDVAIDLLFDWLKLQSTSTHRQFMRFVTGSPSLSTRRLLIRGPAVDQGVLPKPHTCFGQIDLPNYTSMEELNDRMLLAISSEEMGME